MPWGLNLSMFKYDGLNTLSPTLNITLWTLADDGEFKIKSSLKFIKKSKQNLKLNLNNFSNKILENLKKNFFFLRIQ